ncbi:helix-turn-helix domain-containing protein [Streptomyces sp. NPDC091219]|uniref:TetR/AcrR family transcriptional regulator n=1 Tax=Streptomyces sp. NPDC091219 TaxID=3155193 RepID=UPI00344DEDC9
MGRRERKKAATRQALADAALELFLEHGYDQVSIRDVAEAADVSTTTLFKHFPSKEALVFDLDADQEAALVTAVRERAPGTSVPRALRDHLLGALFFSAEGSEQLATFHRLVRGTPALTEYHRRMWMRHQHAVAAVIAGCRTTRWKVQARSSEAWAAGVVASFTNQRSPSGSWTP